MTGRPDEPLVSPAQRAPGSSRLHASAALQPSEYTAALIQVLRARAAWVRGAHALEIGSGSGVVLAALTSRARPLRPARCCCEGWDMATICRCTAAICGCLSPVAAST